MARDSNKEMPDVDLGTKGSAEQLDGLEGNGLGCGWLSRLGSPWDPYYNTAPNI